MFPKIQLTPQRFQLATLRLVTILALCFSPAVAVALMVLSRKVWNTPAPITPTTPTKANTLSKQTAGPKNIAAVSAQPSC